MSHHAHAPTLDLEGPHEPHERTPWGTLALMLAAQLMVILDISVVNVALPSIGKDLSFGSGDFQWIVSAYVLLSGGLLLLGGRLADLFDRRRIFITGLGVFTAASLLSGLAGSAAMLTLSRAAQGAGAAMLTPAALSLLMTTYSGRQRNTALAIWGTVGSMGIAAGVLFGGVLTSSLDWRAVFFVNVPIGVVVGFLAFRTVPAGTSTGSVRQLDVPGAIVAVGALLSTVYGIEASRNDGWTSPASLWSYATATVLFALFAFVEARSANPLVPNRTWRIRSLTSGSFVMAAITGTVVGAIFLSSLYLQTVLGSSAVVSGLQFLPLALSITAGAAVSSRLLAHTGPKTLMVAGLVIVAVGAALLSGAGAEPTYARDVLPGFVVLGLGTGPMFVAISVAAMHGIPEHASGLASGVMMTGHEIGAALGVAVFSALAGDLATSTGLLGAFPTVFEHIAWSMLALAALCVLIVPNGIRAAAGHGHGHGHGHG